MREMRILHWMTPRSKVGNIRYMYEIDVILPSSYQADSVASAVAESVTVNKEVVVVTVRKGSTIERC